MIVIKKVSNEEIIIESVHIFFSITRRYVKVDQDLWYNKKLHQRVTGIELKSHDYKYLLWGVHEKRSHKNRQAAIKQDN